MADVFLDFTGTIDRRSPRNKGDYSKPVLRENWLCRNGILKRPKGTLKATTNPMTGIPRWAGRYYTVETGQVSPKTFAYTEDGNLWVVNDQAKTATNIKSLLNINAYPKHCLFKTSNQTKMFLVDGKDLYRYDGNNDNNFEKLDLQDADGKSINPIDVIEHNDRLILISKTILYISKNLYPETFDDANDSLAVIVGSGRGENLAVGKIEDKLYIFNTEGIFILSGDVISALAITFEVRLVDETKIIAGRTAVKVEKAINFLADDYEIWSWDGAESKMLTYDFVLKDSILQNRDMLDKASAVYSNNYYQLSFVEKGDTEPNTEIWWDAFENKIDVVKGRNVSCYMTTDPTRETSYLQTGRSDINYLMDTERENSFDGVAIRTRLRTKDIVLKNGQNVRIAKFYPQFEPTGDYEFIIRYLLNSRLSNPDGAQNLLYMNLEGENIGISFITINNQSHFTQGIRPKIKYSRGESIAFEVDDSTLNLNINFLGIGMDLISKHKVKSKKVGA